MSNGKGSKPRPLSVSYERYSDNFDEIFRKKKLEKSSEQSDTYPDNKENKKDSKNNDNPAD